MKSVKKPTPSLDPQHVGENCWYYETRRGIEVVAESPCGTRIHKIPWSELMESAVRCGKVK